ncbi:MAG: SCO family protein [Kofleriaceae bacterium]
MSPAAVRQVNGRRVLLALAGVLLATVIPAVVLPTLVCREDAPALEDYGAVPEFAFVDHLGQPASLASLTGYVTIVNFIFTRCESVCPVSSMKMERLQARTADLGAKIKLLSISVDPAYDTPERLATYAARFKADPGRWRFLTGPVDAVRPLVEGPFMTSMMVVGQTPSGAPDIAHNEHFFLVDKHAHIRGAYDSTEVTRLDLLARHARYLSRQP